MYFLFFCRKSESILFPEDVEKSVANLVKFILHHTNESIQLDVAMSVCSTACMQRNIGRILEKVALLERKIRQLERRAKMLWSHVMTGSRKYIQMASETVKNALSLRTNQLRKVQLMNHVLQKNNKNLDTKILQDLLSANR